MIKYHPHNDDNQVRANPSNSLTFHWSFNSSVDNYEQEVIFTYSYTIDFSWVWILDITCCVGNMIFWWIGVIHGNMSRHFQCFCVSQSLNKEGDIKSCCKWIFGVFWEKLLRSILRKNKKVVFRYFKHSWLQQKKMVAVISH